MTIKSDTASNESFQTEQITYHSVKEYIDNLSSFRNFEFQAIIKSDRSSLEDIFGEGPEDGSISSLNIIAAKLLIDRLEQSQVKQNVIDIDNIAKLRDQLAEVIDNLGKNTTLPNSLSQQLLIFAAIEEEIAGKTPLVEQYCDQIISKKSSHNMVYDNIIDSVILFMRRYDYVIDEFKELLINTSKLRDEYLVALKEEDLIENEDKLEPITIDDRIEFESYILMLEIPVILYEYLLHYYGKEKISIDVMRLLEEIADELYERGFKSFSLIPNELARMIPRIEKRLVRNINFSKNKEALHQFLFNKGRYELWPPQIRAINNFSNLDTSYFIYQPTSSGKSLIAEIWIFLHLVHTPEKFIIYLVPMKSLATQVTQDLSKTFSKFVISNLSGVQLHPILDMARKSFSNLLVMTPEKFNLMNQNGEFSSNSPSTIIIDEAHGIMGKNTREFTNSISILKFKLKHPKVPILALSAVIDHPETVEKWVDMQFKLQGSDWRSTRLKTYKVDKKEGVIELISEKIKEKTKLEALFKRLTIVDHTVKLFEYLEFTAHKRQSVIIFCQSRSDTIKYAKAFYLKKQDDTLRNDKLSKFIEEELGKDDELVEFVKKGIAYHHAGLPPNVKNKIEDAIRSGDLNVICSTTTLAEGLNTPVDIVIIPNPYIFTGRINEPMLMSKIQNMFGRAGRAFHGGIGKAFIYTDNLQKHQEVKSKPKITFASNVEEAHPVIIKSLENNSLTTAEYTENEILKFRTSIYSLVCDGAINSKNINKFMNKIDPIRKVQFKKPIIKTVGSFSKLPELLEEHSPLKATELGWLCYRTGLDPISFKNYIEFIGEIKETISFIENTSFLNLNQEQRRKLLKILLIPDEARIDGNNLIAPEYRILLLDIWLMSDGSLQKTKSSLEKETGLEFEIYKISTTIFDTFGNTVTWISWAFNQIIEFHFDMNLDSSYTLLPFYIKSGRTDPFYAILSGFNLSKETINNYLSLLPEHLSNSENVSELFEWIVYKLPQLIEDLKVEDNELNSLLFKSLKSPNEWDQAVFLASFISGWYELALNALSKSKINFETFERCLDNILFTEVEYAETLKEMQIDEKINSCFSLLERKKTIKGEILTKILTNLIEYFPEYKRIERI